MSSPSFHINVWRVKCRETNFLISRTPASASVSWHFNKFGLTVLMALMKYFVQHYDIQICIPWWEKFSQGEKTLTTSLAARGCHSLTSCSNTTTKCPFFPLLYHVTPCTASVKPISLFIIDIFFPIPVPPDNSLMVEKAIFIEEWAELFSCRSGEALVSFMKSY